MKKVYLDNAATSCFKPDNVINEMIHYLKEIGCSPGRGGYESSLKAGRIILEARVAVADLFNVPDPKQIIFTHNINQKKRSCKR